jgi:UDP-glucose 4-epimerase
MKILVVGGAGYIGSHLAKLAAAAGHEVVSFDNLSTGFREALIAGRFVQGDLGDTAGLAALFGTERFDAVMHFASLIQVAESVVQPGRYYRNNYACTLNLLEAMVSAGVRRLIFSSTAAVFGEPDYTPIDEAHPLRPINPYGQSKLMVERTLADFDRAHGMKSVALRYFNAAGADPDGELGERHDPETHLIPLLLQAASGRREAVSVFGSDYDTPDGTCIRDYIHVADLCQAHLLALDFLAAQERSAVFNLGNGSGFSVRQVVEAARRVTGREIPIIDAPRREGDPARLVADSALAREALGWAPRHCELDTIVAHAWRWERKMAGLRD